MSVSTNGTLEKAHDSGSATPATVNGVTFEPSGSAGDDVHSVLTTTFAGFDNGADLGDPGLDQLLRTGRYDLTTTSFTITLSGLDVGSRYELQVFFMDQRALGNDRVVTLSDGGDSVTLEADPGNSNAAPFGQYVLGVFTADATTQPFTIAGPEVEQINAWQLRLLPAPAPLTRPGLALLGLALLASAVALIRPQRAGSLTQDPR